MQNKKVLLQISNLKQWFPVKKEKIRQEQLYVKANDGISVDMKARRLVLSVSPAVASLPLAAFCFSFTIRRKARPCTSAVRSTMLCRSM